MILMVYIAISRLGTWNIDINIDSMIEYMYITWNWNIANCSNYWRTLPSGFTFLQWGLISLEEYVSWWVPVLCSHCEQFQYGCQCTAYSSDCDSSDVWLILNFSLNKVMVKENILMVWPTAFCVHYKTYRAQKKMIPKLLTL